MLAVSFVCRAAGALVKLALILAAGAMAGTMAGEKQTQSDPLREPRTNMFIAALLEWGAGSASVTVRNLSESGALVEGAAMPPTDAEVRLVRGSLSAAGTVAWVTERRCGLRLEGPVPVALWMAKPGNVGQAEIDAAVRRIKAGQAVTPLPNVTVPGSLLASEPDLTASIRALEAQLAAVSDELASDPETVVRHSTQLQTLDLMAQGLARLREGVGR